MAQDRLTKFCEAIRDFEGSPPNDRNYRNNNAGNCKYYSGGYAKIYGEVKKDKDGFAIFKDYETGFLYLKNMIKGKIKKNPTQTLLDFMKIYAPESDNNPTTTYAKFVGKRVGMKITDPMSFILDVDNPIDTTTCKVV